MYKVEYIRCRVCASDEPRWIGVRGNREHAGFSGHGEDEHQVTNVVRCARCGFVYTNPFFVDSSDPDRGYGHPESYESSSAVDPSVLFNATLDRIGKWSRPPGRLLDVGCGKGEFLLSARRRGWQVKGVERSRAMADYAAKESGLEVFCGELKQARWEKNSFDVVTLNMVLEHVDDPHTLLEDAADFLKDGGHLFVEVPNMGSLMLAGARWYFKLRGLDWAPHLSPLHPPYHAYGYSRKALLFVAGSHGFVSKEITTMDLALRGFRPEGAHRSFEKWARYFLQRMGAQFGYGDVLVAVFQYQHVARRMSIRKEAACASSF